MAENILSIDQLRERADLTACCPFVLANTTTKESSYWAHLIGLRAGDVLKLEWFTPSGLSWFSYDVDIEQDWWYYYYWTYINPGDLPAGWWKLRFSRNNQLVDALDFFVGTLNTTAGFVRDDCHLLDNSVFERIDIFDINGKKIALDKIEEYGAGIYIEKRYMSDGSVCIRKVLR